MKTADGVEIVLGETELWRKCLTRGGFPVWCGFASRLQYKFDSQEVVVFGNPPETAGFRDSEVYSSKQAVLDAEAADDPVKKCHELLYKAGILHVPRRSLPEMVQDIIDSRDYWLNAHANLALETKDLPRTKNGVLIRVGMKVRLDYDSGLHVRGGYRYAVYTVACLYSAMVEARDSSGGIWHYRPDVLLAVEEPA